MRLKKDISIFDQKLYLAYIFFLPLDLVIPREGFPTILRVMSLSTMIMLLGVVSLCVKRGIIPYVRNLRPFWMMFIYMTVQSLIAASVIYTIRPVVNHESVLWAPIGDIVLYLLMLLSLFYNYYCLSYVVKWKQIFKIFDWSIIILMIVGYTQLALFSGNGVAWRIYDLLSSVLALVPAEKLIIMERGVCCFGSEPSSMMSYSFILLPYLIGCSFYGYKRKRHLVMLALLSILLFGSNSSSVVIAIILTVVMIVLIYFGIGIKKWLYIGAFSVGLCVAVMYSLDFSAKVKGSDAKSIEYVAYGKIVDQDNYSTMMRASTVAVDMKEFYRYPLTGVGMGLQGVWYNELVPSWTKRSFEVQHLMSGKAGIPNGGGNFFPAYISAFGIIGIIIFIVFAGKYVQLIRKSVLLKHSMIMSLIFKMGMALFILSMWYTTSPQLNENAIFLLSLPLIVKNHE